MACPYHSEIKKEGHFCSGNEGILKKRENWEVKRCGCTTEKWVSCPIIEMCHPEQFNIVYNLPRAD